MVGELDDDSVKAISDSLEGGILRSQKVVIPKKGGQKVKGIYVKLIVDLLDLAAPDEIAPETDDETQNSTADDE